MRVIFELVRAQQWVKNFFVLAPAFFGGVFTIDKFLHDLVPGFFCFCFVSSAIYILNDLLDVKADKLHPEKKNRPIAAGKVAVNLAAAIMFTLFVAGAAIGWWVNKYFFFVLLTYAVINVAYSAYLKRISILDVLLVSSGFILRVLAGGILAGVVISHWLYIMTFLIALFIAIAKRRDDVLLLDRTGSEMRQSIKGYSLEFVNSAMAIMSAVIIVAYILYVTSPEIVSRHPDKPLYISVVFVIAGLLRYLQITLVEKRSGSPTKIVLSDLFIQAVVVGWTIFFAFTIYA